MGSGTLYVNVLTTVITGWNGMVFIELRPIDCEDDFWEKRHSD